MKVFNSDEERAKRGFQSRNPGSRKAIIMVYRILACFCLVNTVSIVITMILYYCGVIKSTNNDIDYVLAFILFALVFIGVVCLVVSTSFNKWHKEQLIIEKKAVGKTNNNNYLKTLKQKKLEVGENTIINNSSAQSVANSSLLQKQKFNVKDILNKVLTDFRKIISNNEIYKYIENFIKREKYIGDIEILSIPIKPTRTGIIKPIYKESDLDENSEDIIYSLKTALGAMKNKSLLEEVRKFFGSSSFNPEKKEYYVMFDIMDQLIERYETFKSLKNGPFGLRILESNISFMKCYERYKRLFFFKKSLIEQELLKKQESNAFYLVISELQNKNFNNQFQILSKEYSLVNISDENDVLDKLFEQNVEQMDIEEYIALRYKNINSYVTIEQAMLYAEKIVKDYSFKVQSKRYLTSLLSADNEERVSIDDIDLMSGIEFERYIGSLFKNMGYSTEITKASGDQGVDIIAVKGDYKIAIQAKCYSSVVGNHAVMEAVAGMKYYKANKCMVITNNFFTKSARELAESNGVELWDRSVLIEKIEEII